MLDITEVNPQTGPFFVEGAEPGDTLAIHIVDLTPARDWAASCTIPFFGALTGTDRTALLNDPLPERTWIYQLDRAAGTVRYEAANLTLELPIAPMLGTVGVAPPGPGGALVAGARRVRRQHGHPGDEGRHHLLPRGERAGRAVLGR